MKNLSKIILACGLFVSAQGCAAEVAESEGELSESAVVTDGTTFAFNPGAEKVNKGQFVNAFNATNAYWNARFSDLAYKVTNEATLKTELSKIGLKLVTAGPDTVLANGEAEGKFFEIIVNTATKRVDTQAIYIRTNQVAILAFRGTTPTNLNDVVTDLDLRQVRDVAWTGPVHKGFTDALDAVWGAGGMREFIAARHYIDGTVTVVKPKGVPLYVTGHSLGGALGTLMVDRALFDGCLRLGDAEIKQARLDTQLRYATPCMKKYIPVQGVYTFGAPRTGTRKASHLLASRMVRTGTSFFRFVNQDDVVPSVPTARPIPDENMYSHVGLASDCIVSEGSAATFSCPTGANFDDRTMREASFRVHLASSSTAVCGGAERRFSAKLGERVGFHDLGGGYIPALLNVVRKNQDLPCTKRSPG